MVTIENYEEYLMVHADGELDATGKAALEQFLEAHPELREEAASWQQLRLEPDTSMVYTDKEALLQKERKTIVLPWKPIALAAAAAVAGLLIAIPALQPDQELSVSGALLIPKIVIPATNPTLRDTTNKYIAALPVPEPVMPKTQSPKKLRKPSVLQVKTQAQSATRTIAALAPKALDVESTALAPAQLQTQELVAAPVVVASTSEPETQHNLSLPRITVAAANKPAIDLIKRGLEARFTQASNAAKVIKETALVVKLGGNNVHINL